MSTQKAELLQSDADKVTLFRVVEAFYDPDETYTNPENMVALVLFDYCLQLPLERKRQKGN